MIRMVRPRSLAPLALAILTAVVTAALPAALSAQETGSTAVRGTGLPLPRFASLKSSKVNARIGPGENYEVAFVYVRAGLPIEITQEFDNWRKIRDAEGSEAWVFHSLLSGRRTVIVAPWEKEGDIAVRSEASEGSRVVAYLQPGVVAEVTECTGSWCHLRDQRFDGWVGQDRLWGVYPSETLDD
jgi:SH3-like domain-containing protein